MSSGNIFRVTLAASQKTNEFEDIDFCKINLRVCFASIHSSLPSFAKTQIFTPHFPNFYTAIPGIPCAISMKCGAIRS